jgi:hypothetical protein
MDASFSSQIRLVLLYLISIMCKNMLSRKPLAILRHDIECVEFGLLIEKINGIREDWNVGCYNPTGGNNYITSKTNQSS